jgi:fructose-1,6-bisphosphatase I
MALNGNIQESVHMTLDSFLKNAKNLCNNGDANETERLEAVADIMRAVADGCKFIAHKVAIAGIEQSYLEHGATNDTGDDQKALDVISNDYMIEHVQQSGRVAIIASEENKDVVHTPADKLTQKCKYAVAFDPLDGSSNIECSVSVGTIFGIYECHTAGKGTVEDFIRPGTDMIAAGYCLYSSSTIMVLSLGTSYGVRAFTIDPKLDEFVENPHSPVKIPAKPKRIISGNTGNAEIWNLPTSEFVRWT